MSTPSQTTEHIVLQADYDTVLASLPPTGTDGQQIASKPVMIREYRLNTSDTINAGKWLMWSVSPKPIVFTWQNGAWQPPATLVVRRN